MEVIKNENTSTTTPLLRHTCKPIANQLTIDQFVTADGKPKPIKISSKHEQSLRESMSKFVSCDLRPFKAVEGFGLNALLCAAFELGRSYPNMTTTQFQNVLPSRATVQRYMEIKSTSAREMLTVKLQTAFKSFGGFACTTDLWTDNHRQITYLAITGHISVLYDTHIAHEAYTLCVEEIQEAVKSMEVVEFQILKTMASYGFSAEDVKSGIHFVTDRGSQFKTTDKFKRSNCSAHIQHNIVKAMCQDDEAKEIISNAASLVRYIKKAGINYQRELHLKSYCETRWSTVFIMLSSILPKYDLIYAILEERQKKEKRHRDCLKYIERIPKSTLAMMVELLRPFKEWTDFTEGEKHITIHRVWPVYTKINEHLKMAIESDPELLSERNFMLIEGMKARGREYIRTIESDFSPTMEHSLALALHPRMKRLTKISPECRSSTFNFINQMISNGETSQNVLYKKEQKRSISLMDEFVDSDVECNDTPQDNHCKQFAEYLNTPIPNDPEFSKHDDSQAWTSWWFKHKSIFPDLFKLFMRISAIPSSSAPSERCFSVTGQIITNRRSCIAPESVSNIIMCRNLYRNS